jgi:hypothetical protein
MRTIRSSFGRTLPGAPTPTAGKSALEIYTEKDVFRNENKIKYSMRLSSRKLF